MMAFCPATREDHPSPVHSGPDPPPKVIPEEATLKLIPVQEADFLLHSYSFPLPEEHIAQQPAECRDGSRLMVLDRKNGTVTSATFADILHFLPENCLLVANNSKVVPARLWGRRKGGGQTEVLLLTPPPLLKTLPESAAPGFQAEAEALLRPAKKIRPGERVSISGDLELELVEQGEFGRCRVLLHWQGDLQTLLQEHGSLPLPPYIRRQKPAAGKPLPGLPPVSCDAERYQTVYARDDKAGSAAAPTAGLHFTPQLREALKASGREWTEVTLYVGYGTFSPVRCEDIREHSMHAEYIEISQAAADAVNRAKREGRPIVAVGTTSARTLEGAFAAQGGARPEHAISAGAEAFSLAAHAGWVNIFLYPGTSFQVVDGLITNFHLPESSLLMLVSALAGRERVLAAYARAQAEGFRFFSYGDAMLIL